MGQQQLLLLVLGIVIVGIAVVAGIQAFSEGKIKAEQDAAISDAMRIISDVQAWKLKPGAFGGGGDLGAGLFTGVNFKALGYQVVSTTSPYASINGCYVINATGGQNGGALLTVYAAGATTTNDPDGIPNSGDETQSTTCTAGSEIAEVNIMGTGTDPTSLGWTYL